MTSQENGKHIIKSPFPSLEYPARDTFSMFDEYIASYGDKIALVDSETSRAFTFTSLRNYVQNFAKHLHRKGFTFGTKFGLWASNSTVYIITYLAVWRLGGIAVYINNLLSDEEARREALRTDCHFMLFGEEHVSSVSSLMKTTNIQHVFVEGESSTYVSVTSLFTSSGASQLPVREGAVDMEETIGIFFSSGTTGLPNGVELCHRNFVSQLYSARHLNILKPSFAVVIYQPLSHIYGHVHALSCLVRGTTVITMSKFNLEEYLRLNSLYKCNHMALVPPIVVLMCKNRQLVEKYNLSNVTNLLSGAAPLALQAEELFLDILPNKIELIQQGYGMTETTAGVCFTPDPSSLSVKPQRLFQVGVPITNILFKIVDLNTGKAVPPHKHGEICIKGPCVMKGYLDDKEATERTIDKDGWLHSGDIGYHDEHGFIYLIDRLKELIKYKAYQVAPAELEDVLLCHPAVSDAGVIGIHDEEGGEVPMAFVVTRDDKHVTQQDICEFVAGKVAPFKKLRGGVQFVSAIPKSSSGKILRRQLRGMAAQSKL